MKYERELVIRSIKITDIGYITVIYFVSAFYVSMFIDKLLGKFDPEIADKTSTTRLLFECIFHVWCLGVLTYAVKNIVELIPFPLDGIYGYDHRRLKELDSAAIFSVIIIVFQKNLYDKLEYVYKRLNG